MGWLYKEEFDHPPWATVVIVIAHAIWAIFLSYVLVDKLIVGSLHEYLEHFTNWSLTLVLIFAILTLVTFPWKPIYNNVLLLLYLPVYGTTWVVYLGVAAIFLCNPELLIDYFKRFYPGFVIDANEIFHSLPLIIQTTYGWYYAGFIRRAIKHAFDSALSLGIDVAILFVLYQLYSPILLIGFYSLLYNANEVYGVSIPGWAAALAIFIILSVFNGIPLLYIVTWRIRRGKKKINKC